MCPYQAFVCLCACLCVCVCIYVCVSYTVYNVYIYYIMLPKSIIKHFAIWNPTLLCCVLPDLHVTVDRKHDQPQVASTFWQIFNTILVILTLNFLILNASSAWSIPGRDIILQIVFVLEPFKIPESMRIPHLMKDIYCKESYKESLFPVSILLPHYVCLVLWEYYGVCFAKLYNLWYCKNRCCHVKTHGSVNIWILRYNIHLMKKTYIDDK